MGEWYANILVLTNILCQIMRVFVECTVFYRCILENEKERGPEGPFPLLDLSSILIAKGIDPLAERTQLIDMQEKKMHNALTDVEVSIQIWKKYMN